MVTHVRGIGLVPLSELRKIYQNSIKIPPENHFPLLTFVHFTILVTFLIFMPLSLADQCMCLLILILFSLWFVCSALAYEIYSESGPLM